MDGYLIYIFVQTVAFGSMATSVAEDLSRRLVDRFRSLPMVRSAVLTGHTVADLVRNMFVVVVMLTVGLLVLSFAFSWIRATIGLMMRSAEAV